MTKSSRNDYITLLKEIEFQVQTSYSHATELHSQLLQIINQVALTTTSDREVERLYLDIVTRYTLMRLEHQYNPHASDLAGYVVTIYSKVTAELQALKSRLNKHPSNTQSEIRKLAVSCMYFDSLTKAMVDLLTAHTINQYTNIDALKEKVNSAYRNLRRSIALKFSDNVKAVLVGLLGIVPGMIAWPFITSINMMKFCCADPSASSSNWATKCCMTMLTICAGTVGFIAGVIRGIYKGFDMGYSFVANSSSFGFFEGIQQRVAKIKDIHVLENATLGKHATMLPQVT